MKDDERLVVIMEEICKVRQDVSDIRLSLDAFVTKNKLNNDSKIRCSDFIERSDYGVFVDDIKKSEPSISNDNELSATLYFLSNRLFIQQTEIRELQMSVIDLERTCEVLVKAVEKIKK